MCVHTVLNTLSYPIQSQGNVQSPRPVKVAIAISSILCFTLGVVGLVLGSPLPISLLVILSGVSAALWLCCLIKTEYTHKEVNTIVLKKLPKYGDFGPFEKADIPCAIQMPEYDSLRELEEGNYLLYKDSCSSHVQDACTFEYEGSYKQTQTNKLYKFPKDDDFGPFEKADIPCAIQMPEYDSLRELEKGNYLLYKDSCSSHVQDACTFEHEGNYRRFSACGCFDPTLSCLDMLEAGESSYFKFTSRNDAQFRRFLILENESLTTLLPSVCQCNYCYICSYFPHINFRSYYSLDPFTQNSSILSKLNRKCNNAYKICYLSDSSDGE